MNKSRITPAVETLEGRLALSTLTIVNDTTRSIVVQLVRHQPAYSGQLSDGTSFGAPEPGYTEWTGSYKVKAGTAVDFNPGDSRPDVRVSYGGTSYIGLKGTGIVLDGQRYSTLSSGYDLKRNDNSSTLSVTIGNHNYGSRSSSSLSSLGVTTLKGFYTVPNDETLTIHGPKKITGTSTFSFADSCGNLSSKSILHSFNTPHGTSITGYQTHITSARGNGVSFYKIGNSLVESGSISGGGLFSYGGSYAGTVTVNYAYP